MASEIQISVVATLANGYLNDLFKPGNISVDQSVLGKGASGQLIGTSNEVVNVGDATNGWCFMRNLNITNYVTYGPEVLSGTTYVMQPFGKMKPGEIGVFRLETGVILRAQANAASCWVDIHVWSD
jgi:hypothetical protein